MNSVRFLQSNSPSLQHVNSHSISSMVYPASLPRSLHYYTPSLLVSSSISCMWPTHPQNKRLPYLKFMAELCYIHCLYFRNISTISLPKEGILFIYNTSHTLGVNQSHMLPESGKKIKLIITELNCEIPIQGYTGTNT